jgi:hypothetical protein
MTALTDAIRGRGYWRIVVRPVTYNPQRVPYTSLRQTLERSVVQLRGWDFPHLDRKGGDRRGNNWIGGETAWSYYREAWSFYRSGQLVYLVGMHGDWHAEFEGFAPHGLPTTGKWLGAVDTLYRLTETFEFAARLALTEAGAERMAIEVNLRDMEGRRLWDSHPSRFAMDESFRFDEPELVYRTEVDRTELAGESRALAVQAAIEVFARFDWHPSEASLKGQQDELRRGQAG